MFLSLFSLLVVLLPLCRSCRKPWITAKPSSSPSTCAAPSSRRRAARRARPCRTACPRWTRAGTGCAPSWRSGGACSRARWCSVRSAGLWAGCAPNHMCLAVPTLWLGLPRSPEGCSCSPESISECDHVVPKHFIWLENVYMWTAVQSSQTPPSVQLTRDYSHKFISAPLLLLLIHGIHSFNRHLLSTSGDSSWTSKWALQILTHSYHTGPVSLSDRYRTKQSRYTTASLVEENRQ